MALILPYRLYNKAPAEDTIYGTLVFVQNTQSKSPVKAAGKEVDPAATTFEYFPWQILNPSIGACESFDYTDELFLVARFAPDAQHELPAISAKTPVYCGQNLVLTRQGDKVGIAPEETSRDGPITVFNPAEPGPGSNAQLDWYLGDLPMGRILNLAPGATARFQLGGNLYFHPFQVADGPQQTYSPETVESYQHYLPPLAASADVGVRVYFALENDQNGNHDLQDLGYVFCPPSKDWRPAKAGDPPPCRRFEGPTSGSEA